MTAYFLFIQANREAVQKELGVKDFGPVTRTLSSRWKTLAKDQMAQYEKQAAEAKVQYEKALAAFQAAGGVKGAKRKEKSDMKAAKAEKKAKKEANIASGKPKKPAGGAYGVFLSHHRAEIHKSLPAGSDITAVSKLAGQRFKALGEKDKKKYEDEYQEKKAKYEEELKVWRESTGGENGDEEDDEPAVLGGA